MRHTIYFIALISFQLPAQPAIQWQKSLGGTSYDEGKDVEQTLDGGYIILTEATSTNGDVVGNHGGRDFWLIKLNQDGIFVWKKIYGGSGNDNPYCVQQTTDGGYIMAGHTESNNWDVSGNHGARDAWIVKTDSLGIIQWKRCYGGTKYEEAQAIRQTRDGGYIFVGFAGSDDGDVSGVVGDWDYWVVKIASNGDIQWQQTFGSSGEDIAHDVRQTTDGGFIVAGKSSGNEDGDVTGGWGGEDYWIIKLAEDGSLEWKKSYGGNNGDVCEEIVQTADGGYVMVGYVLENTTGQITGHHGGYYDYWVAKINSQGTLEWQRALGGSNLDYGRSICLAHDGGYVVAGESSSLEGDVIGNHGEIDMWVIKLDQQGQIVWKRALGGALTEFSFSIQSTTDSGYILAGANWSSDGDATECKGKTDLWVVKLNPESSSTQQLPRHLEPTLWPNPVIHKLNINIPEVSGLLSVCISDAQGRTLQTQTMRNTESIDLIDLPPGFYFITIYNEHVVWSAKVIKA